jgi:hypothetical protein
MKSLGAGWNGVQTASTDAAFTSICACYVLTISNRFSSCAKHSVVPVYSSSAHGNMAAPIKPWLSIAEQQDVLEEAVVHGQVALA